MSPAKLLAAALILEMSAAEAETFVGRMLNRDDTGSTVFEPAFVWAQIGNTVVFLPNDKGHRVESIEAMLPEGVQAFGSGKNAEFSMRLNQEGICGMKCEPQNVMGIVAPIQAGAPVDFEEPIAAKQKGKAKGRFDELLTQVQ